MCRTGRRSTCPTTSAGSGEFARLRIRRLFLPLLREANASACLASAGSEPAFFADATSRCAESFADQAVIAIENVRLFNETKEALERQTATADILKVIASSPSDVQPVFDAIVDQRRPAERRL